MAQIKSIYVEQRHPNAITETKGGYRTYIGTGRNDRRLIQRRNKSDLIDFLYSYYKAQEQPTLTLAEAMDAYISYKKEVYGISDGTEERNRYTARFYSEISDRPLDDLTADDIRRFIRSKAPFKEYAIKAAVQLIHGTYRWALANGRAHTDPTAYITPSEFFTLCDGQKKTAEEKIFLPLDIERIKTFVRQDLPNMRAFAVLLSIETGMRSGEIVSLKWEDIKEDVIHIHTQQRLLIDADGKRVGFEELPYTKDERKHPHDGRLFPLTDEIRHILDEIRACEDNPVYVLEEDGHWITKTSYEAYLRKRLMAAGYNITNNHAFRMSLNSNVLIPAGLSPAERAYILGHSIETNERYYSYTRREQATAIGSKLENHQRSFTVIHTHAPRCVNYK